MYDNYCVDCDRGIPDDYERCYPCNQAHRNEELEISIDGVETTTNKAILVMIEGEGHWLPSSQATADPDGGRVFMPRWLAEDKELI